MALVAVRGPADVMHTTAKRKVAKTKPQERRQSVREPQGARSEWCERVSE